MSTETALKPAHVVLARKHYEAALMDLLKSMPEGTVGATWPTFYKPEAFVLLLYVTAIGTNLNWIFGQIS